MANSEYPRYNIYDKDAEIYPCADCGILRSERQGGRIFTVCDECWEKHHQKLRERPNRKQG